MLDSQFGNPRGLLGQLVGVLMAIENRERNRWALSLLDIRPADHLLEIGFGPGWAIKQASQLAVNGLVAGVDRSEAMVRQASWRNRRGIQAGRVALRLGSSSQLPFDDGSFDKAYAVNSFHEWGDPAAGLRQARRVLKPNGLVVIVEHPHARLDYSGTESLRAELAAALEGAGFGSIQFRQSEIQGRPAIAAIAAARTYVGRKGISA